MLRQTDARLHIGLGVAAQSRRLTSLLIQVHAELSPLTWGQAWRTSTQPPHGACGTSSTRSEGDAAAAEDIAIAHFEQEGALIIDQHLALLTSDLADAAMKSLDEVLHSTAPPLASASTGSSPTWRSWPKRPRRSLPLQDTSRSMLEALRPVVESIVVQAGWPRRQRRSFGASGTAQRRRNVAPMVEPHRGAVGFRPPQSQSCLGQLLRLHRNDMVRAAPGVRPPRAHRPVPGLRRRRHEDRHGAQAGACADPHTAAVAGADLSMDFIERAFLRSLGRRDEHIALITETGKVVASNSARFAPGTRFEGPRAGLVGARPVADLAVSPVAPDRRRLMPAPASSTPSPSPPARKPRSHHHHRGPWGRPIGGGRSGGQFPGLVCWIGLRADVGRWW